MEREWPEVLSAAPTADRRGTSRQLSRLLSCIRFDEVFVLQGAPLLGATFSMSRFSVDSIGRLVMFAIGSCLLVAHIFVVNDWSGIYTDRRDPNRAANVFTARGIGRDEIGFLALALLVVSLLVLAPFGFATIVLAVTIAGLSALYSAPSFQLKGVPLASSVLHLVGGLLHFMLGYSIFQPVDIRSLAIGGFFALVFSGGHLIQEVRDLESDRVNGIRTNAVRFGKARTFVAGLALFTTADLLLVVLASRTVVPRPLIVVGVFYAVHLFWSLQALHAGLTFDSVRRLQVRYRMLYAAVGVLMIAAVLF